MIWYQVFRDGPDYEKRKNRGTFVPPNIAMKDLHDAVPPHLFKRSTLKSLFYIIRHLAVTAAIYKLALQINVVTTEIDDNHSGWASLLVCTLLRPCLQILYWGWQGMAFAGIWCLGDLLDKI